MKFVIDKQTLEDLNLLGRYKNNSVYNLYNHTVTRGGGLVLEKMFLNPMTNAAEINTRKDVFSFFQTNDLEFPFTSEEFDVCEKYLGNTDHNNIIVSFLNHVKLKANKLIANNEEYSLLHQGLLATINVLVKLGAFMNEIYQVSKQSSYHSSVEKVLNVLNSKDLSWIFSKELSSNFKFLQFVNYDHKLRYSLSESLNELLKLVHELDVNIVVAQIAKQRGFVYAKAVENEQNSISLSGVYHPCVPNAVANDIYLDYKSNVLFLTGANMAGKSTLMKSFGVSIYLAHMGFPIAAKSMDFTVLDGIYTSINVPDDLNMGYSHFYAEVVRVKKIATEVASGKKLVVMFDELFKGTNVKDAYDATVAVTEAFSKIHKCSFIVSTHIMEAGLTLKERCDNIKFKYLPTVMRGSVPTYPYILDDGISNDRHGMMIINNERIVEIIKGEKL